MYNLEQLKTYINKIYDMHAQPGTIEGLHQQMKKLRFEGYNKKMTKQFRDYKISMKRERKKNGRFQFLNCKPR